MIRRLTTRRCADFLTSTSHLPARRSCLRRFLREQSSIERVGSRLVSERRSYVKDTEQSATLGRAADAPRPRRGDDRPRLRQGGAGGWISWRQYLICDRAAQPLRGLAWAAVLAGYHLGADRVCRRCAAGSGAPDAACGVSDRHRYAGGPCDGQPAPRLCGVGVFTGAVSARRDARGLWRGCPGAGPAAGFGITLPVPFLRKVFETGYLGPDLVVSRCCYARS